MGEGPIELLIRRAAEGDREAAGELARRYEKPIRRAITRRLGRDLKARIDTDDIYQSTIIAAMDGLPGFTFQGEPALVSWLATIAERRIRMAGRRHRRGKRDPKRERPIDLAEGVPGSRTCPSEGAVRGEIADWLRSALEKLPEDERRIVELHSYGGMSFEEAAKVLGLSGKSGAHNLFQKALRRMGGLFGTE